MRILSFKKEKWDKKFLIAFLITLVCSIICGIVLFKPVTVNFYFIDFAEEYVFNVFNFDNSSIFLSHFLSDILYFYIFFFLCYFTRFKYLTLVFLYIRGLFFGIYVSILIVVSSVGGILVAVIIFIPSTLISVAVCFFISDFCRCIDKKIVFFVPAVLALIDGLILILLINVVFRVIIIIV